MSRRAERKPGLPSWIGPPGEYVKSILKKRREFDERERQRNRTKRRHIPLEGEPQQYPPGINSAEEYLAWMIWMTETRKKPKPPPPYVTVAECCHCFEDCGAHALLLAPGTPLHRNYQPTQEDCGGRG